MVNSTKIRSQETAVYAPQVDNTADKADATSVPYNADRAVRFRGKTSEVNVYCTKPFSLVKLQRPHSSDLERIDETQAVDRKKATLLHRPGVFL